ncbi:hypothetical protein ACWKSP_19160 [Micromonosporaceae bacterium Da 78-11]
MLVFAVLVFAVLVFAVLVFAMGGCADPRRSGQMSGRGAGVADPQDGKPGEAVTYFFRHVPRDVGTPFWA